MTFLAGKWGLEADSAGRLQQAIMGSWEAITQAAAAHGGLLRAPCIARLSLFVGGVPHSLFVGGGPCAHMGPLRHLWVAVARLVP